MFQALVFTFFHVTIMPCIYTVELITMGKFTIPECVLQCETTMVVNLDVAQPWTATCIVSLGKGLHYLSAVQFSDVL